jgi:putative transposase
MQKAFKYRINPTKGQQRILEQQLETCRWVYNETLATRKRAWEERQESLRLYDTIKILPAWKADRPDLNRVHSQVLQNIHVRVDLAFKAFFRRVKAGEDPGFPRFKQFGRYDSITYPQYGNGITMPGCKSLEAQVL